MGTIDDATKVMKLVDKFRVVIDSDGEAINFERARKEHGITPDIVFIRNDSWALGAQNLHRNVAYNMWSNDWTHFYLMGEQKLQPISEYER